MYLLKQYLLSQFNIQHVWIHQDKRKPAIELTTADKLNIKADELIGTISERPIDSHINTPFAICINGTYQPNKYRNKICSTSGEREAREFLKVKLNWMGRLIDSIE